MGRGAAIVEACIAFVVLTLFTLAIIQYAVIQNAILTVQYDTREAARYACVHYTDTGFGVSTVQTYLKNYIAQSSSSNIPYTALTSVTYYSPGTALDNGSSPPVSTLTVEIKYDMTQKYLLSGLTPGLPSTWTYTYYFTTFAEGS
jgi:hypothetical protein